MALPVWQCGAAAITARSADVAREGGGGSINLEVAGADTGPFGDGPFALILSNPDGDTGCFDITNAIVGNQIPTPARKVRRGVRR
ncbi:hypothetical protein [Candidatus Binatus sp.]|uniref:hypothetical protein n=2 Tax=Candidatus Binatus sp. TaxID=2811406 RepID=UPI003CC50620